MHFLSLVVDAEFEITVFTHKLTQESLFLSSDQIKRILFDL